MSGAAGLSAAKRRRGSAQTTSISGPPTTNTPQIPQLQQQKGVPVNPIKVLEHHELRLRRVEPRLENAFEGFEAHEKRLEEIENIITRLLDQTSSQSQPTQQTNVVNEELNEQQQQKIVSLEKEILELKQLVTKVQTFAMETNISLQQMSRNTTLETSINSQYDSRHYNKNQIDEMLKNILHVDNHQIKEDKETTTDASDAESDASDAESDAEQVELNIKQ